MKLFGYRLVFPYFFIFVFWCFICERSSAQNDPWRGIGPYGGNINCLAMDQTNPDVMLAGTDYGLFQTSNGGKYWNRANFPELKIIAIEIVSQNPPILYIGTKRGIYSNQNGSGEWSLLGFHSLSVNAIAISPKNSDTLFVGTSRDTVGIFKSVNGGMTWELKKEFKNWASNSVNDLLFDQNDPAVIYTAVTDRYHGVGFYKSTDCGESWFEKKIGKISPRNISKLTMTPPNYSPASIYAVKDDEDVYKSTDRGETWQATNVPAGINFIKPYGIAVDPNQPEIIYVGLGSGFYKSSDSGVAWTKLQNGQGGFASIRIDPRDNDVFVGSAFGGVFCSTDGGLNWEARNRGIQLTTIHDFAVPAGSDSIYASIVNGETSLARYDLPDDSWHFFNTASCNGAIAINPQDHRELFGGPDYKYRTSVSIFKSTDGGKNWSRFTVFNLYQTSIIGVSDIWINPEYPDTILAAINGGTDFIGLDGGG